MLDARLVDLHERGRDAGGAAHRDDRVVEGRVGVAREHDDPLGREALEGDRGLGGERVKGGKDRNRTLLAEQRRPQPARRRREARDDGIEPPGAELFDQAVGRAGLQRDLDGRRGAGEMAQRARHARGQRVREVADAQAHRHAIASVAGRLLRHFGVAQDVARLLEQRDAGGGERDAALGAVEQLDSELLLELAYLLAHRGLGHVEALGGAAEVQFLGHGDEVPQMTEFHSGLPVSAGGDRPRRSPGGRRGRGRSHAGSRSPWG